MHTQVVLVPGRNDGRHLARTVSDLVARYPAVQTIGVVPVGLTRYHRGDCAVYTADQARAVIAQIEPVQAVCRERFGVSLIYLADEWYLLAGAAIPPGETYDDYAQIENGVGLVRQFLDDYDELEIHDGGRPFATCTLACGTLIAPLMTALARQLSASSGVRLDVVPVPNRLFGETVTVSGLLGGKDVMVALREHDLGEVVFLPRAMFDDSGERTLDDLTVGDFARRLNRPVIVAGLMSQVVDKLTHSP
jgi:putative radical SAM enzyme (TIGR03279 family)